MYYLMEKITENPEGAIYLLIAPFLIYLIALQVACPLGRKMSLILSCFCFKTQLPLQEWQMVPWSPLAA